MKFIKRLLIFTILMSLSTIDTKAQSSSLRELVPVVRPVYSETTLDFLYEFSNLLMEEGYKTPSKRVRSIAKGGFGSGFLYTSPSNGQNYIITNRHVVIQTQYADIEFMLEDQSVKSFKHCEVVAVDQKHDLAMIALPVASHMEKPFEINTHKQNDGTNVFTLGYPALGNKPSWQLGSGIISNSNLHIEENGFGDFGVIQHTGQIDPGSSGGPLLIRTDSTYQIIGMNTSKAIRRESVNMAIPSSIIMDFVNDYFKNPENSQDLLEQQIKTFLATKDNGYSEVFPFISNNYISNITPELLMYMLSSAEDKLKEEVLDRLNDGSPLECIRLLVANRVSQQLINNDVSLSSIENYSEARPVQVKLNVAGEEISTSWVYQQSRWCIANVSNFKVVKKWGTDMAMNYNYSAIYTQGFGDNSFGEINLQKTSANYILYSFGVHWSDGLRGINFGAGGYFPIKMAEKIYLIPYSKGFWELNMQSSIDSDAPESLDFGYKLGSDIAISLYKDTYLLIGGGFKSNLVLLSLSKFSKATARARFNLHVGVAF